MIFLVLFDFGGMDTMNIRINDVVFLKSFNGSFRAVEHIEEAENYWKLIGERGVVTGDNPEFTTQDRLLVQFDRSIKTLGLICHNDPVNSLWILRSDLEMR